MKQLNEKEKKVLEFITDAIRSEGYPPTVRDIQNALHIKSTATVHSYLARLEEKGYIRRDPGKSRSMRIGEEGGEKENSRTTKVPVAEWPQARRFWLWKITKAMWISRS